MDIWQGPLPDGRPDTDHAPAVMQAADHHALPGFEAVARLAAGALGVPLVALLLTDGSAFWYTPPGLPDALPLDDTLLAICRAAMHHGKAELLPDAREDLRFLSAGDGSAQAGVGFFAC